MFHVAFYRKCITIITISIAWTGILIFALFVDTYITAVYQHTATDVVEFFKKCAPLLLFLCILNTVLPILTLVHYRMIIKEHKRISDYKSSRINIPYNTK